MIMKKTYINPETSIVLLTMQSMIAVSNPEGFDGKTDDENPINPEDMLSRRRKSVWDDGMEEEEEQW